MLRLMTKAVSLGLIALMLLALPMVGLGEPITNAPAGVNTAWSDALPVTVVVADGSGEVLEGALEVSIANVDSLSFAGTTSLTYEYGASNMPANILYHALLDLNEGALIRVESDSLKDQVLDPGTYTVTYTQAGAEDASEALVCTVLVRGALTANIAILDYEIPLSGGTQPLPTYRYDVQFENGINAENAEDVDGMRTLQPEGFSCGPYIDLLGGTYRVSVTGENLTGMTYDVVSESGDVSYTIYNPTLSETELTFGFILSAATPRVEVRFFNQGTEPVTLASCVIEETETEDIMDFSISFADNEYLTNGEDKDGVRYIYEAGLSYGPYLSLIPGIYNVSITGTNLEWALPKFTSQYGADTHTLYNLQTTPTNISYRIQVTEMLQATEITLYNPTPDPITVESITIKLQ